jgi:hypothetical protein
LIVDGTRRQRPQYAATQRRKSTFDKAWILLHGGEMSKFMDEAIVQGRFFGCS